ncbi:MAG TPA: hypothetical protein VFL47_09820 [Flavisolibacter sp.]|nr:hypothetical protein [Flavisolibacter sp.]
MKTFFPLLLLLFTLQAGAQKNTIAYDGSIRGGLLEGDNGSAFQLQTVNGIRYKTWSAGIGAGLDYYFARSLPVFLELRKSFGSSLKAPFVYAGGGYNFPWLKEEEKEWGFVEANGGLYADAGIGYQIPVLKKSLLFFSLGYSQKAYERLQSPPVWIDIYPSPPMPTYTYQYNLRRISIKTGLRF